ncbi:MAG: Nif11 domain [Phycisphaerales bacterium]|nr:Nif11 domain [Phycisphaerales bacterium]
MPQDEFERFREHVLDDPVLQRRLLQAPADTEGFIAALIEVASGHGYTFDRDEVRATLQAAQLSWMQRGFPVWI